MNPTDVWWRWRLVFILAAVIAVVGFAVYRVLIHVFRAELLFVFVADLGDYYHVHGNLPPDLNEFDRWYFAGHGKHRWPGKVMSHVVVIHADAANPLYAGSGLPLIIVDPEYKHLESVLNRSLLGRVRGAQADVVDDLAEYYRAHENLPVDWEAFVDWYSVAHKSQRWSARELTHEFTLNQHALDTNNPDPGPPLTVLDPNLKECEPALNSYLLRHIDSNATAVTPTPVQE